MTISTNPKEPAMSTKNTPEYTTLDQWADLWLPNWLQEHFGIDDRTVPGAPYGYSRGFDDLPPDLKKTDAAKLAYRWAFKATHQREAPRMGLVFTGPTGTGKTSIMVALWRLSPVWTQRPPWHFHTARGYVAMCKDPELSPYRRKEAVGRVIDAPMVCLDDLGTEPDTDWDRQHVCDLIEERHARGLGLHVTTNLTEQQLLQRYGPRTIERLLERSRIVALTGISHRARA